MWIYRSLLALVGGGCLVILSATLTRSAASVAPTLSVAGPPKETATIADAPAPVPNADAERCLNQTFEAFRSDRVAWLQMAIWQKVQLPGCAYEAEGSYRLAPGQRFRLEMHIHPSENEGTLLSVSDGHNLWQAERPGSGTWENITRLNLADVFALMNGPAGPQLRNEFLQRPHFQGMTPLLINLRGQLVWSKYERLRQSGGERIHLVGVWPTKEAAKFAPPDRPWPTSMPHQCHVYLDAHTYWPQRVEWWGPNTVNGVDCLLVQMEFRNPVFNRPLPNDECNRLFAFHPGEAVVEDQTPTVAAEMTRRANELTPRSATR